RRPEARMGTIQVAAERPIGAPAERVYRYIADFTQHHFRFLPPAFSDLRVERGGYGAGTVITFKVTVAGRTQAYRTEVEEPERGRGPGPWLHREPRAGRCVARSTGARRPARRRLTAGRSRRSLAVGRRDRWAASGNSSCAATWSTWRWPS